MSVVAPDTPNVVTRARERTPTAPKRRRRWHRLAIPFGLLILFWGFTVIAHAVEQPNLSDPGTLSPTGTGPDGSSELARRLQADGVTIERVTTNLQALQAAAANDATIFVPAPSFVSPSFLSLVKSVAGRHRI